MKNTVSNLKSEIERICDGMKRGIVDNKKKNIVYICCWQIWTDGTTFIGIALATDGKCLAKTRDYQLSDVRSSLEDRMGDYRKHYPSGYTVEWLDYPFGSAGFLDAMSRNHGIKEEDRLDYYEKMYSGENSAYQGEGKGKSKPETL